jgi:hypothetical protein
MEVSGQLHAPTALPFGKRASGTHWIGGWVDPRAGLDDVEKRKFLSLPGLEPRPLFRPARSQSLYRLSYPGSCLGCYSPVKWKQKIRRNWSWTNRGSIPTLAWKDWWKSRKTSVRKCSVQGETRTNQIPRVTATHQLFERRWTNQTDY